jgi:hypothetical protein
MELPVARWFQLSPMPIEGMGPMEDYFESMNEDERFDYARVKHGPEREHLRLTEGEYAAELNALWGKDGVWTSLLQDEANARYRLGLETVLPYYVSEQACRDLILRAKKMEADNGQ